MVMRDFTTPSPLYTHEEGHNYCESSFSVYFGSYATPSRGARPFPAIEQLRSCTGRINDGTADGRIEIEIETSGV